MINTVSAETSKKKGRKPMLVKHVYEHVIIRAPLDVRKYLDYFNETLAELSAMYDGHVFKPGFEGDVVKRVEEEVPFREVYFPAVVDNILFLSGYDTGGTLKSEFIRKSQSAYDICKRNDEKKARHIKKVWW